MIERSTGEDARDGTEIRAPVESRADGDVESRIDEDEDPAFARKPGRPI